MTDDIEKYIDEKYGVVIENLRRIVSCECSDVIIGKLAKRFYDVLQNRLSILCDVNGGSYEYTRTRKNSQNIDESGYKDL